MGNKAEPIYRDIAQTTNDQLMLGRARLRLAEFSYQRGYLDEARNALLKMQEKLPKQLVEQWQDLLSRVLMAQGRYNEAGSVLTNLDNAGKQSQYTRYNLGVALINDGRAPQGRDLLDRVGRMRVMTLEDLALRDKANLTLGWHFLHIQLGGSAKAIFQRVRSEGPFSNRALLGLGWAELAPRGAKQEHSDVADPDDRPFFSSFSTLGVLLRPGFVDIDIFKRAGNAMASIKQGRMVETIVRREINVENGWEWKLTDLPDAPETYYLQNLLAEHRFQEALKNYRDTRMMASNIDGWVQRIDAMEAANTSPDRAAGTPDTLVKHA